MARKVIVELVDDYDGESKAEETVLFSVDGVAYEIDLSILNAEALRGVFERWTPHARKIGRVQRSKAISAKPAIDRDRTAAIREWARKEGIEVSSRGRISAELIQQYEKASA
ncbi:Lsr2 family protein [Nocardia fluminea]|uniref:histone-like nucleoid-structuring protein Lsr2 n=1 Tax=Nocardia fluminea TaxID=134984 RepID=UPI003402A018